MDSEFAMWALGITSTICLAAGAWFFGTLRVSIQGLKEEIAELRVAIVQQSVMESRLTALERQQTTHEALPGHTEIRLIISEMRTTIGGHGDRLSKLEETA